MTAARPAPWRTNWTSHGPASFAHQTVAVRLPQILRKTMEGLPPGSAQTPAACRALLSELTGGALRGLHEPARDREAWDAECTPHLGRSWLDLPWYFAESFFYRRILEATGFFQPGPGHQQDPFLAIKQEEETQVAERVTRLAPPGTPLPALLRLSLWGNRADLSYAAGRAFGEVGDDDDLLCDDTSISMELLSTAQRVDLLLDNAGTELALDLRLATHLTSMGKEVTLWVKEHPFFVSDATAVDVERTCELLGFAPFRTRSHPHLTSSGFLFTSALPASLAQEIAAADVVIAKGDANYRRLLGDAPWPHQTPFDEAARFPAPLIALRTCKAEVLVGVRKEIAERAARRDARWLVNGRFGVVQALSAGRGSSNGP